jgi:hypothetical protein
MRCEFKDVRPAEQYVLLGKSDAVLVDPLFPRWLQISVQIPHTQVQHAAIKLDLSHGSLTGQAYRYGVRGPLPTTSMGQNRLSFNTGLVSGVVDCSPAEAAYAFVPKTPDEDTRDPSFSSSVGDLTVASDQGAGLGGGSLFYTLDKDFCVAGDAAAAFSDLSAQAAAQDHRLHWNQGRVAFFRQDQVGCGSYADRHDETICVDPVYATVEVVMDACVAAGPSTAQTARRTLDLAGSTAFNEALPLAEPGMR